MYVKCTPGEQLGINFMGYLFILFFSLGFLYVPLNLLLNGQNTDAEIIEVLPNEVSSTNKQRHSAWHNNRHRVKIDKIEYELILQKRYAPQVAKLRWAPPTRQAIILSDNGDFSIVDVFGTLSDFAVAILGVFVLLTWPIIIKYSYVEFLRSRKN